MKTYQEKQPKKDEPVFLLQASDPLAADVVRVYSDMLYQKGQQSADEEFRKEARIEAGKIAQFADEMEKYKK